jgi:hypothetical protein
LAATEVDMKIENTKVGLDVDRDFLDPFMMPANGIAEAGYYAGSILCKVRVLNAARFWHTTQNCQNSYQDDFTNYTLVIPPQISLILQSNSVRRNPL